MTSLVVLDPLILEVCKEILVRDTFGSRSSHAKIAQMANKTTNETFLLISKRREKRFKFRLGNDKRVIGI